MIGQYFNYPKFGPLAQLVEQWTFNPRVPGSNPGRPTIYPLYLSLQ